MAVMPIANEFIIISAIAIIEEVCTQNKTLQYGA